MLINEKGLCKLLKQEYKKNGYTIFQEEATTIICVAGMQVVMASQETPRQLLGLLVEHSGEIPENCAIKVMAEIENQTMIQEAMDVWTDYIGKGDHVAAMHTPIIWDDYMRIYQCEDQSICAVTKRHLEVLSSIAGDPVVDLERGVAAWYKDNMEVHIPIVTQKENAHFAALESHKWTS